MIDDLIPLTKAAKILGVDLRSAQRMVRQGMLKTHMPEGKRFRANPSVRKSEVYALHEARAQRLDLAGVATMAIRAHVSSRTSERLLGELLKILNISAPTLGTTEEEVLSLHQHARERLLDRTAFTIPEISRWAQIFVNMTEEYLALVQHFTADEEPWKTYLDLALQISGTKKVLDTTGTVEHRLAYGALEYSRRNLRAVSYFYVRSVCGKQIATEMFSEMGGLHEEILALALT